MPAPAISLGIIAAVVLGTIAFALLAVRRVGNDPRAFILGGGGFGAVLLWVLMGGEFYSTFTFLGVSGWAYDRGAEAYYLIGYGICAYIIGYLYLPKLWRFASERGLLTAADFFAARYASPRFGALVALAMTGFEFFALLTYLTGLQLVLSIAGFGTINASQAVLIAFGTMTFFIFTAGLRGMAWASIVKDALTILGAFTVGIVLPIYFFGSPAHMLDRVIAARPHDFIVGDWTAKNGKLWFYSTMVLTSLGFFCGSAPIAATYSAKSEGTLRRNAIFLPLYSLMMLPIFFAGYTASLVLPGLHGQAADTAYLHVLQSKFPAALLGIVCSAGALAGLIPFASRLLSTSSLLTKNVLDDLFGARLEGAGLTWATRIGILVIASGSLVLWLFVKASLVDLLLFAYNGSTQVAPALLYGLFWKRASLWPIAIGLSAGVIIAVILTVHAVPTAGLNPGFVALAVNFALTTALILWWPRPHQALPTAPSAEHR